VSSAETAGNIGASLDVYVEPFVALDALGDEDSVRRTPFRASTASMAGVMALLDWSTGSR
jgi:hypothetical protein